MAEARDSMFSTGGILLILWRSHGEYEIINVNPAWWTLCLVGDHNPYSTLRCAGLQKSMV